MTSRETRATQTFLSYHDFVKAMALKYAPWPGLTEDISQQVFLEFIAKEERWDLERDLRPLLATMTRFVAMRLWRERTREKPEVVQKLAEHIRQLSEEQQIEPRFEQEIGLLNECLNKLPDTSRNLVQLYYYHEIGTPEIAEQLNMKADTVCRALSRVREKLRECIQRRLQAAASSYA